MTTLIFDTETNDLLRKATKLHCICILQAGGREVKSYHDDPSIPADGSIHDGLARLAEADEIIAHNLKGFDYPVLRKLYPDWDVKEGCVLTDTLRLSKLHFSDLAERDRRRKYDGFPGNMMGKHSLGAWGLRLGNTKDDYGGGWANFSFDMLEYCQQDVRALYTLYRHLLQQGGTAQAWELEDAFADELEIANQRGVRLDVVAAEKLFADLSIREAEVEEELRKTVPPFVDEIEIPPSPRGAYPIAALIKAGWEPTEFTPSGSPKLGRSQLVLASDDFPVAGEILAWRAGGYSDAEGCEAFRRMVGKVTKTKVTEFNPGSDAHKVRLLKSQGWVPHDDEYTKTGQASVTETILSRIDNTNHPELPLLLEYAKIGTQLGQVKGWLKLVDDDGFLFPYINHIGTITHRCSHSKPNLGNVDADPKFRGCFIPRGDYKILGSDADSVEIRILAHFLAPFDDGGLCKTVRTGADLHEANRVTAGLDSRAVVKMVLYATLYGMGANSLGKRLNMPGAVAGKIQKKLTGALGVDRLEESLKGVVRQRGWIKGLDGRRIPVRTLRSALNTLIQSGASVLIKQWTVLVMQTIRAEGLDAHLILHVHDEMQIEVSPEHADRVAEICQEQMLKAGEALGLRVPTTADFSIGNNWAETH